jgi:hypothetical protein
MLGYNSAREFIGVVTIPRDRSGGARRNVRGTCGYSKTIALIAIRNAGFGAKAAAYCGYR